MDTTEAKRHLPAGIAYTLLIVPLFLPPMGTSAQKIRARFDEKSSYTGTIEAFRDNQKTVLQSRSVVVSVAGSNGKNIEFVVTILFDPETRLFWWNYFENFKGYDAPEEMKAFARSHVVYVTATKLLVFFGEQLSTGLALDESIERVDSLPDAQKKLLRFFEKRPPPSYQWRFAHLKSVDYMSRIPRDYFQQCYSAMLMLPRLQSVRREENQWRVRIAGPNQNAADILLGESYSVVSVQLEPVPPVTVVSQTDFPGKVFAQRNGDSVPLQARRLNLQLSGGCQLPFPSEALLIYEPRTHLGFALRESVESLAAHSTIALSGDKIVCFNCIYPGIEESTNRFDNLEALQRAYLERIGKKDAVPQTRTYSWRVSSAEPPANFYCDDPQSAGCPPTSRVLASPDGNWQFAFEGQNGTATTVHTDSAYQPIRTDVSFLPPRRGSSSPQDLPVLQDLLLKMSVKDLAAQPAFAFTNITNKSSTIRAFRDGQAVTVQALRLDVHYVIEKQAAGTMLVIYEPSSKFLWFVYQRYPSLGKTLDDWLKELEDGTARLIVTGDKFAGFSDISYNNPVMVQESRLRYSSIAEGLSYLLAGISQHQGVWDGSHFIYLPLPDALHAEPSPSGAVANEKVRYIDIRREGANWRFQFEGIRGRRADLWLAEDYRPLKATFVFPQ